VDITVGLILYILRQRQYVALNFQHEWRRPLHNSNGKCRVSRSTGRIGDWWEVV